MSEYEKRKEYFRNYNASHNGKAKSAAYRNSAKGQATRAAYMASDKRKAARVERDASGKSRKIAWFYRFKICNPTQEQFEHYEATTKCDCCGVEFGPNGRLANGKCQDHDHKTNKLRGVICSSCNRTEGHAGTTERAYQVACYIASNMTLKELIEGLP